MQEKFSLKKYLTKGFVGGFTLRAINTLLSFVVGVILARVLGPSKYGIYAYVMVWIGFLGTLLPLGFDTLLAREVAVFHAADQWGKCKGLLLRSNQIIFFITFAGVLIAEIVFWGASQFVHAEIILIFQVGMLILPFLALGRVRQAILRGFRYVILAQMPEMLFRYGLFLILILVTIWLFGVDSLSPLIAISLHLVAVIIMFLIGTLFLLRRLPSQIKSTDKICQTKMWFYSALPFLFLSGVILLSNQVDIIILGIISNAKNVAIYRVVVSAAQLVLFVLVAFTMVIAPIIARLYVEKDYKKLQRLITLCSQVILLLTLPIVIFLVIFGHWFLSFVYGSVYGDGGAVALMVLAIAQFVNASCCSVSVLLNMTNHEKENIKAFLITMILNIILSIILIPKFGINGAAFSNGLGLVLWNLILYFKVKQKVGIDAFALAPLFFRRNKQ